MKETKRKTQKMKSNSIFVSGWIKYTPSPGLAYLKNLFPPNKNFEVHV
jgi:hypothetical protein